MSDKKIVSDDALTDTTQIKGLIQGRMTDIRVDDDDISMSSGRLLIRDVSEVSAIIYGNYNRIINSLSSEIATLKKENDHLTNKLLGERMYSRMCDVENATLKEQRDKAVDLLKEAAPEIYLASKGNPELVKEINQFTSQIKEK